MNRSIIYFIALFSLGAGWGHAILTDNNLTVSAALGTLNYLMGNDEDISKDIVRTAPDTKILKIVKTDKARQVRKNSKIRRIQPEQFKGSDLIIRDEETQRRISKIEAMVDSSIKEDEILIEENNQVEFNYKLIGIRSGNEDSSVIVKKGNKEFLVVLGDILEGSFELVEVNQNDALFRKGQKMYRIERQKDK